MNRISWASKHGAETIDMGHVASSEALHVAASIKRLGAELIRLTDNDHNEWVWRAYRKDADGAVT